MLFKDFLTSCIGKTRSQLKTERAKQKYLIEDEDEQHICFFKKVPMLEFPLKIINYLNHNQIVESCHLAYFDSNDCPLNEELLESLQYNEKSLYKEFVNPHNGSQIGISGYFLTNDEYLNDYDLEIRKIPYGYISMQDFMKRKGRPNR